MLQRKSSTPVLHIVNLSEYIMYVLVLMTDAPTKVYGSFLTHKVFRLVGLDQTQNL